MSQTTKTNENRGCCCGAVPTDAATEAAPDPHPVPELATSRLDPVCGMTVGLEPPAALRFEYEGATFWFCCAGCHRKFVAHPSHFLDDQASAGCCS